MLLAGIRETARKAGDSAICAVPALRTCIDGYRNPHARLRIWTVPALVARSNCENVLDNAQSQGKVAPPIKPPGARGSSAERQLGIM